MLLDAGASPHPSTDASGRTLLHHAAASGDAAVCAYLAAHGSVKINAEDGEGASPLDLAVMSEHPAAATAIKEQGGTSRLRRDGGSLVHILAASGKATSLAMLLTTELVEAPDEAGLTPLHLACAHGQCATAKALIDARADVNRAAASAGSANGAAAPTHAFSLPGSTPFHLACMRGDAELCELLIEGGANVATKLGSSGESPLHLATSRPDVLRLLLAAGAGIEEADGAGLSPLQVQQACHRASLPHETHRARASDRAV